MIDSTNPTVSKESKAEKPTPTVSTAPSARGPDAQRRDHASHGPSDHGHSVRLLLPARGV